jgi:hypothetical protein
MNPFVSDLILAEKKLNMLSNGDKSTLSKNLTNCTNKHPASERRLSLTKAYSCSDTISSNSSGNCSFITPKQFADLYSTHERKCLPIVDCRSQIDFGCERIRASYNVNCRAKLMARKLQSKSLVEIEPSLASSLNNSDTVILYDQSTDVRTEEKLRALPINLVVQAAKKSNKKVYIIQGRIEKTSKCLY